MVAAKQVVGSELDDGVDLVLFDPTAITDTATFDNPTQQALGISHVIVNGQCAIEDGRPTGQLAGRALRMDPSRKQTL